ncbi:MAG: NUDIX domain-containing protein [Candidatus Uhrbacteria bacterium]
MNQEKDFYQVSLKAIIKNDQDEILLLAENSNSNSAGFYDLPGGRIAVDEFTTSFIDILKREITEEIGNVKIDFSPQPVAVGRHFIPAAISKTGFDIHVLYLFFEAKFVGGKVVISDEHTGFKWVDFSKEEPNKFLKSGNLEGIEMYFSEKF